MHYLPTPDNAPISENEELIPGEEEITTPQETALSHPITPSAPSAPDDEAKDRPDSSIIPHMNSNFSLFTPKKIINNENKDINLTRSLASAANFNDIIHFYKLRFAVLEEDKRNKKITIEEHQSVKMQLFVRLSSLSMQFKTTEQRKQIADIVNSHNESLNPKP